MAAYLHPMERTILVTGGDKAYFLMGCMLVHSLRTCAPRLPVYFLDFGLERPQRKFLDTICTVVRRPEQLGAAQHPYSYKAAMGEYLRAVRRTSLVWLDSDMIAVGAVGESLKAVLRQMDNNGREVAACVDSCGTIGDFIAKGQSVGPFVEALATTKIAPTEPYLNVGFVICRSQAFLDDWRKLTNSFTTHTCFEQNAFNIVVRTRGGAMVLSDEEWNVHGRLLRDKTVGLGGSLILHATSDRADEDLTCNEWVAFGDQRISSTLKLFRNPFLRKLQETVLMDFMRGAHRELQRLGILA